MRLHLTPPLLLLLALTSLTVLVHGSSKSGEESDGDKTPPATFGRSQTASGIPHKTSRVSSSSSSDVVEEKEDKDTIQRADSQTKRSAFAEQGGWARTHQLPRLGDPSGGIKKVDPAILSPHVSFALTTPRGSQHASSPTGLGTGSDGGAPHPKASFKKRASSILHLGSSGGPYDSLKTSGESSGSTASTGSSDETRPKFGRSTSRSISFRFGQGSSGETKEKKEKKDTKLKKSSGSDASDATDGGKERKTSTFGRSFSLTKSHKKDKSRKQAWEHVKATEPPPQMIQVSSSLHVTVQPRAVGQPWPQYAEHTEEIILDAIAALPVDRVSGKHILHAMLAFLRDHSELYPTHRYFELFRGAVDKEAPSLFTALYGGSKARFSLSCKEYGTPTGVLSVANVFKNFVCGSSEVSLRDGGTQGISFFPPLLPTVVQVGLWNTCVDEIGSQSSAFTIDADLPQLRRALREAREFLNPTIRALIDDMVLTVHQLAEDMTRLEKWADADSTVDQAQFMATATTGLFQTLFRLDPIYTTNRFLFGPSFARWCLANWLPDEERHQLAPQQRVLDYIAADGKVEIKCVDGQKTRRRSSSRRLESTKSTRRLSQGSTDGGSGGSPPHKDSESGEKKPRMERKRSTAALASTDPAANGPVTRERKLSTHKSHRNLKTETTGDVPVASQSDPSSLSVSKKSLSRRTSRRLSTEIKADKSSGESDKDSGASAGSGGSTLDSGAGHQ